MEDRSKENATNDDINLHADTLTDLPVGEELADETRGGATAGHIKVFDNTGVYSGGDTDIIVASGSGASGHIK
jgi:hypothetical protein